MVVRNVPNLQPGVKRFLIIVGLTIALIVSVSCYGTSGPRSIDQIPDGVSCQITSHTNGDTVGRYITVEGTTSGMKPEWSMYSYARAKLPGEPWWLSDKKAIVIGNDWTVDVVIGNAETPPGTEFQVAIVVTSKRPPAQTDDLPNSVSACANVNLARE